MVLTLYKLDASPPVRAVLMTIEALDIPDVEYVDVNLIEGEHLTEEYSKINPQRIIPTLKDDDFIVWDSHAIAAYLVATYGKNDSLYPTDPKKRAIIDQRLHFDSGVLFPAMRTCGRPVIFLGEKSFRQESLENIESAYDLTEKFLTTPWLAGDNLTLADICCVATITSMNEILPIDKEKTMVLTLYKKDTSAPCMSVFMVLEALNIKNVNYVEMNIQQRDQFKPDYLKINPQHTIPTLKDDDFIIWDSHAIVTYLVTKYAKDDSLYPKDPQTRALIDQRLHFDSGVIFPALRQSMIPLLFHGEKSVRQENLEKIKIAYEILEKFFTGAWLAGDSVTLADICCYSTIGSLNELLPIDASLYPNLSAWVDRCSKLEIHVKSCASARKAYQNLLKNILA